MNTPWCYITCILPVLFLTHDDSRHMFGNTVEFVRFSNLHTTSCVYSYFSHNSLEKHVSHKLCFVLLYNFCAKHFSHPEYLLSYGGDAGGNAYVHAMFPLFLSLFNQHWNKFFIKFFKYRENPFISSWLVTRIQTIWIGLILVSVDRTVSKFIKLNSFGNETCHLMDMPLLYICWKEWIKRQCNVCWNIFKQYFIAECSPHLRFL
jgi:hypothetical protein